MDHKHLESHLSLLSADSTTLITDGDKIINRWVGHFNKILNQPSSINDEAKSCLPKIEVNSSLAKEPTFGETEEAITLLSNGKAPGRYQPIQVNVVSKNGFPGVQKCIHHPPLPKKKGHRQSCDNHRGISLLSIAGNILERILLNHPNHYLE